MIIARQPGTLVQGRARNALPECVEAWRPERTRARINLAAAAEGRAHDAGQAAEFALPECVEAWRPERT